MLKSQFQHNNGERTTADVIASHQLYADPDHHEVYDVVFESEANGTYAQMDETMMHEDIDVAPHVRYRPSRYDQSELNAEEINVHFKSGMEEQQDISTRSR